MMFISLFELKKKKKTLGQAWGKQNSGLTELFLHVGYKIIHRRDSLLLYLREGLLSQVKATFKAEKSPKESYPEIKHNTASKSSIFGFRVPVRTPPHCLLSSSSGQPHVFHEMRIQSDIFPTWILFSAKLKWLDALPRWLIFTSDTTTHCNLLAALCWKHSCLQARLCQGLPNFSASTDKLLPFPCVPGPRGGWSAVSEELEADTQALCLKTAKSHDQGQGSAIRLPQFWCFGWGLVAEAFSRCSPWRLLFVAAHRLFTVVHRLSCPVASSWNRDRTCVSCIGRQTLHHGATREAPCCCAVAQSSLDSWQPYGLQRARLLCPSLSPRVCPDSCPSSQ